MSELAGVAPRLRTGGEAVVDALVALGARHVFGIPSVHNLPVFDALHDHPAITAVGVRHEQERARRAVGPRARVEGGNAPPVDQEVTPWTSAPSQAAPSPARWARRPEAVRRRR